MTSSRIMSEAGRRVNVPRPLTRSLDLSEEGLAMQATRICSIPDCEGKHLARGYCQKHYLRVRSTGDPDTVRVGHRFSQVDPAKRLRERSELRGECLIYTHGTSKRGGHVVMCFRGRYVGVHRIAWVLANGEVPNGLVVRHRCDVPRCINVAHLEVGTVADNNRDRDERGRTVTMKGSRNSQARLTEGIVVEIRKRLALGESQREIAAAFEVNQVVVFRIGSGLAWTHVPWPDKPTRGQRCSATNGDRTSRRCGQRCRLFVKPGQMTCWRHTASHPLPPSQSHGERRNPLAACADPPDGSEGISGPWEVSG